MLMFRSRQTWKKSYELLTRCVTAALPTSIILSPNLIAKREPLSAPAPHPLASCSLRHIYIFKQTVRAGKHTICYPPEFAWLKILFCISSAYKSLSALVGDDCLLRRSPCSVLHTAIRWQGERKGNQFGHCFELFYSGRLHSRRPFDAPAET